MRGAYDGRSGAGTIGCLNKSIASLDTDGMTYNLVKNNSKELVSTTSMSGKYPDAIRCGPVTLYIQSVDDPNQGVTYRAPID